ncbi:glycosyltransferase [Algibacter sp. L4_22]|uniref:glycosyltransferase n=1 Tax=Algibacter sp. L4_22 TaxID=2942477 RepID=UPI00201B934C|nr:glycosyltransferase [Algibacter sp. L4_22]MCL5127857.1 glycosyltransferase [Algibacter sp. L4_22]
MKRILLIMPYGSVGGMERLALHFYNYYKSKGYHIKAVKFIGLNSDIINFPEDEYILLKKDLSELSSIKRAWFYISAPLKLRKIIKKERISHSIAFGDMANIFSSLTKTDEFKIGSIHALKSVELNSKSIFTKIIKKSYRSIYKNLDKVVCISKAIKKDLIDNCNYKFYNHLEVIYNPHDVDAIRKLSLERIDDPSEKKLFKNDTQNIIFIGRVSHQKSPWHLINAFSLLLKNNENVNLIFIGDGDISVLNYIKKLIIEHHIESHIYFLGRKNNPYKYLKKANVLALSSYYEGTPNVIVEAIALGTPVVSSNCTEGIIELMSLEKHKKSNNNIVVEAGIITPNLYKGFLGFPKNNDYTEEERQMAIALQQALNKKSEFVGQINSKLLEKFDLEFVSKQYLAKS